MTKTLDELHKAWLKASADYCRALRDCDCLEFGGRDCDAVADDRRAKDVALENYDAAFTAFLDAVAEAPRLKTATTEPTPCARQTDANADCARDTKNTKAPP